MKKHEHTVRLTDEEEFVAFAYARHFLLNATNPIPTFLAFGAFGYAKKYTIKSEKEKIRLVAEFLGVPAENVLNNAQGGKVSEAAQLLALLGKSEGSEKGAI